MQASTPYQITSRRKEKLRPINRPVTGTMWMKGRILHSSASTTNELADSYGSNRYAAVVWQSWQTGDTANTFVARNSIPMNVPLTQLYGSTERASVGWHSGHGPSHTYAEESWPFPLSNRNLVPTTDQLWAQYDKYRVIRAKHVLHIRNYSATPHRMYLKLVKHKAGVTLSESEEFGVTGGTTAVGGLDLPYRNDITSVYIPGNDNDRAFSEVTIPFHLYFPSLMENQVTFFGDEDQESYRRFQYTRDDGAIPFSGYDALDEVSLMMLLARDAPNTQVNVHNDISVYLDMNWYIQCKKTETSGV